MGNTLPGFTCCVLICVFHINLVQARCAYPPSRSRTDKTVAGLEVDGVVSYKCQSPYVFPNGDATKRILCTSSSSWTTLNDLTDVCLGPEWIQTTYTKCVSSTPDMFNHLPDDKKNGVQVYTCVEKCKAYTTTPCVAFSIMSSRCYFYDKCNETTISAVHTLYQKDKPSSPCQTDVLELTDHCYWKVETRNTWIDAMQTCAQSDGILAVVDTLEVVEFLRENNVLPLSGRHWIGLTENASPGVLVWTNGQVMDWTNWDEEQDLTDFSQTKCVFIGPSGTWFRETCNNVQKRKFLCQTKPKSYKCDASNLTCVPWMRNELESVTGGIAVPIAPTHSVTVDDATVCEFLCLSNVFVKCRVALFKDNTCSMYDTFDESQLTGVGTAWRRQIEAGHEENYTETAVVKLNDKKVTWAEARDECEANNMTLLTVKNARKADELLAKKYWQLFTVSVVDVGNESQIQILTDTDSQQENQEAENIPGSWMGLTDLDVEGTFKWQDGTYPFFHRWGEDEPSLYIDGDLAGDCVFRSANGSWSVKMCETMGTFLCEYNANEPCLPRRCLNDAKCIENGTKFYCNCSIGFTGQYCETKIPDPCLSGPCLNRGSCATLPEEWIYECKCLRDNLGEKCQYQADIMVRSYASFQFLQPFQKHHEQETHTMTTDLKLKIWKDVKPWVVKHVHRFEFLNVKRMQNVSNQLQVIVEIGSSGHSQLFDGDEVTRYVTKALEEASQDSIIADLAIKSSATTVYGAVMYNGDQRQQVNCFNKDLCGHNQTSCQYFKEEGVFGCGCELIEGICQAKHDDGNYEYSSQLLISTSTASKKQCGFLSLYLVCIVSYCIGK